MLASKLVLCGLEQAAREQELEFVPGQLGPGGAGSALTLRGLKRAAEAKGLDCNERSNATHRVCARCYHCRKEQWLLATLVQGKTSTLCCDYAIATHEPGCEAAAYRINVRVSTKSIDKPPPRFASEGEPYSVTSTHNGFQRMLILTKWEQLPPPAALLPPPPSLAAVLPPPALR